MISQWNQTPFFLQQQQQMPIYHAIKLLSNIFSVMGLHSNKELISCVRFSLHSPFPSSLPWLQLVKICPIQLIIKIIKSNHPANMSADRFELRICVCSMKTLYNSHSLNMFRLFQWFDNNDPVFDLLFYNASFSLQMEEMFSQLKSFKLYKQFFSYLNSLNQWKYPDFHTFFLSCYISDSCIYTRDTRNMNQAEPEWLCCVEMFIPLRNVFMCLMDHKIIQQGKGISMFVKHLFNSLKM